MVMLELTLSFWSMSVTKRHSALGRMVFGFVTVLTEKVTTVQ